MQAFTCAEVDNDAGIRGYPMLHVGGEHEAVIVAVPTDGADKPQDWVHPVVVPMTCGCDDVQVSGILLSTIPLSVLGRELFPMMSITVAITVCPEVDPFGTEKVVRPDPAAPNSNAMFWMGQVEKKSRTGEAVPCEFVICGCWNEVLLEPLAEANM